MKLLAVKRRSWFNRLLVLTVAIVTFSQPALPQATDHSAHHTESGPNAPPHTIAAPVAKPSPEGQPPQSEMMGKAPRLQLYPSLMQFPDNGDRNALEQLAHSRMSQGLPLIDAGSEELMRAFSARDYVSMRDSVVRLRDGLGLLDSGLSTHLALTAGQPARTIALNWVRRETNIQSPFIAAEPTSLRLAPSHLAAIAALTVVASALLVFQFVRVRRVASLLQRVAVPAGPLVRPSASPLPPPPIRVADEQAQPPTATQPVIVPKDSVLPPREPLPRRAWSGILKVVQIVVETPSIKTFRLIDPSGSALPFDYLPGQFMQVEVETTTGEKLKRAYTIASAPTRRAYVELTVKRAGQVSQHLHDQVKVGDRLKISAPYGDFTFTGMNEESVVLIGGGVGITPLMSVIRYLTDLAWPGEIFFVYGAQSTEEFPFRDELEYLQRRHPNLHVLATMNRSEGTAWFGPVGQITEQLLQSAVPNLPTRRIHVCGPPPMMAAVKNTLAALGVASDRIHTEAFGPASLPAGALPPAQPTPAAAARVAATLPRGTVSVAAPSPSVAANTVIFAKSGKSAPLPAGMTVLEAAESVGVYIPWSCRAGISGTCKVKLLEGAVRMDVEEGLTPMDKAAGFILACQAKPAGTNIVIEA